MLLNLGCGNSYHEDWINIDYYSSSEEVIEHNLLNGIPMDNGSAEVVYHSHVLEHFSKEEGKKFITECYRVLKKDGIIRVAVPDLEMIAREYLKHLEMAWDGDKQAKYNYEWIKLELFDQMTRSFSGGEIARYLEQDTIPNETYVFNRLGLVGQQIRESSPERINRSQEFRTGQSKSSPFYKRLIFKLNRIKPKLNEILRKRLLTPHEKKVIHIANFRKKGEIHKCMYDRFSLKQLLEENGFKEIEICDAFKSNIPNWEKYELDSVNGKVRKPDSLFMEAKKI